MKALEGAFNQKKALVEAYSLIVKSSRSFVRSSNIQAGVAWCGDGDRHELLNLVMMPPSNLTKNIQLRTSPAPAALFNTVVKIQIQGFYDV